MFKPLQLAAVAALNNPQEWYDGLNQMYAKRRAKVYELLDVINCKYDKNGVGMFVWAKIPNNYQNGFALADEILEKCHVFITPGGIFGTQGDGYIRVSLCGKVAAFEQAIERLLSFRTKLKNLEKQSQ